MCSRAGPRKPPHYTHHWRIGGEGLPLTPVAPEAAAAIQVRRSTLRMKAPTTDRREQCWPRSDFAQANSSLRVGASRLMSVVSKPGPHLLAAATDLVVWYYLRHTREDCPMLGLRGSRGRDSSVARYPLLPASARSHSAQRLGMHFSNSRHKGLSWSSAAPVLAPRAPPLWMMPRPVEIKLPPPLPP